MKHNPSQRRDTTEIGSPEAAGQPDAGAPSLWVGGTGTLCGLGGELRFDGHARTSSGGADDGAMKTRGRTGTAVGAAAARPRHRRLKSSISRGGDPADARQRPWPCRRLPTAVSTTTASLRDELPRRRLPFFSTSDTEVILKAYHRWASGASTASRHVRLRRLRTDSGRLVSPGTGSGQPLYIDQTADSVRFGPRCRRCWPPAASQQHRPPRRCTLPDIPLSGAAAAHDPDRGPQAAAGGPYG